MGDWLISVFALTSCNERVYIVMKYIFIYIYESSCLFKVLYFVLVYCIASPLE